MQSSWFLWEYKLSSVYIQVTQVESTSTDLTQFELRILWIRIIFHCYNYLIRREQRNQILTDKSFFPFKKLEWQPNLISYYSSISSLYSMVKTTKCLWSIYHIVIATRLFAVTTWWMTKRKWATIAKMLMAITNHLLKVLGLVVNIGLFSSEIFLTVPY